MWSGYWHSLSSFLLCSLYILFGSFFLVLVVCPLGSFLLSSASSVINLFLPLDWLLRFFPSCTVFSHLVLMSFNQLPSSLKACQFLTAMPVFLVLHCLFPSASFPMLHLVHCFYSVYSSALSGEFFSCRSFFCYSVQFELSSFTTVHDNPILNT